MLDVADAVGEKQSVVGGREQERDPAGGWEAGGDGELDFDFRKDTRSNHATSLRTHYPSPNLASISR